MKLMIAIPAYGGSIKNGCVESLLRMQASFHSRNVSADYGILNIAGIPETRNYYASILLQRGEHSHLLFIDSDMAFEPATVWKLLEAQKPLIETEETRRNGLGSISKQRWETLIAQLSDLGDIRKPLDAGECYRTL